jgi:cell pole-organizing protein PopZ
MPWLSLPEYSRLTGTPESSVRALIKAGKLEAHREARAPGDPREVWKIMVDDPPAPPTEHPQPPAASEAQQPQPATTEPPALTTRLLETVLEQAETIAELRERVGRAEAAIDGANARAEQHALDYAEQFERAVRAEAEAARLRELADRPWWRRLLRKPPA